MLVKEPLGIQEWTEFQVAPDALNELSLGPAFREKNAVWTAYLNLLGCDIDIGRTVAPPNWGREVWRQIAGGEPSAFDVLRNVRVSPGLRARMMLLEGVNCMEEARIAQGDAQLRLANEAVGILQGMLAINSVDEVTRDHGSLMLWGALRAAGQVETARTLAQTLSTAPRVQEIVAQHAEVRAALTVR